MALLQPLFALPDLGRHRNRTLTTQCSVLWKKDSDFFACQSRGGGRIRTFAAAHNIRVLRSFVATGCIRSGSRFGYGTTSITHVEPSISIWLSSFSRRAGGARFRPFCRKEPVPLLKPFVKRVNWVEECRRRSCNISSVRAETRSARRTEMGGLSRR